MVEYDRRKGAGSCGLIENAMQSDIPTRERNHFRSRKSKRQQQCSKYECTLPDHLEILPQKLDTGAVIQ